MKQQVIGTFPLGYENVQLVAILDQTGGRFYFCPDDTSTGRIKVGIDYNRWETVVSVLIHEATEYAMTKGRLRFSETQDLGNDHAGYVFIMNHVQFSDVCACVAGFITPALPKLAALYNKKRKK